MDKENWQKRGVGHRERLRMKFQNGGLERFSDEEVVEFLLTLGTPRGDLKVQAREALNRFGSFSGVLSAPKEKLTDIKDRPQERLVSPICPSGCRQIPERSRRRKTIFWLLSGRVRLPFPYDAGPQAGSVQGPFPKSQK